MGTGQRGGESVCVCMYMYECLCLCVCVCVRVYVCMYATYSHTTAHMISYEKVFSYIIQLMHTLEI